MEKIILIVVYFGKLPQYFNLWLKSVEKNNTIDFLIITDDRTTYKYPNNVKVIYSTFKEIKIALKNKFGYNIKIETPYKLCEYKPLYKFIFEDEIKAYDFWGYCDIDIIYGDIRKFLNRKILKKYDKIYTRGHLTFFRNSEAIDKLILSEKINFKFYNYKEAISTNYICHFDEWGGISEIFRENKARQYDNIDFADVNMKKFNFTILFKKDWSNENVIFIWNDGKLFMISRTGKKEEILYAHFQKRTMLFEEDFDLEKNKFIIIPNKFCNYKNITENFIETNTRHKRIFMEYYRRRIQTIVFNIKNGAIRQRIYRFKKKLRIYFN